MNEIGAQTGFILLLEPPYLGLLSIQKAQRRADSQREAGKLEADYRAGFKLAFSRVVVKMYVKDLK